MTYDPKYVGKVEADEKKAIEGKVLEKLTQVLGVEVEQVMAEYVVVMVHNQKSMEQIRTDLEDFMGAEGAETFVMWLYKMLVEGGKNAESEKPVEEKVEEPKKIITLNRSTNESKGTVRLIGKKSDKDIEEALKRRSERFGIPQKERPSQNQSGNAQNKPSITERLGKPKETRQSSRDNYREGNRRDDNRRDDNRRDDNRRDDNRRESYNRENSRKRPMEDDSDSEPRAKKQANDGQRQPPHGAGPRGYPPGFARGPPMYGGFPYGMPPPEFMYYPPPHHMGGYGMPPPYQMRGPYAPRAPRPFSNRKWVNPATLAASNPEETNSEAPPAAEGTTPAPSTDGQEAPSAAPPQAQQQPQGAFAPRGNYFPRPRFQNKTWVRPDATQENVNTEALSASLPKTP